MKYIKFLVLIFVVSACQSSISETDSDTTQETHVANTHVSSLVFLMNFKGKYPYDCQLFDNQVTGPRLKQLLGGRFDFVKSIWNVETPIEINDSVLYAWAMQEQSGGDPSAVIMADIPADKMFAAVRENGKVKLYSESDSICPDRLKQWARESINR